MDQVCFVLPILPGKTAGARDFQRELDGPRKPDYDASERRIGISKEVWYIAETPSGYLLVAYMESPGLQQGALDVRAVARRIRHVVQGRARRRDRRRPQQPARDEAARARLELRGRVAGGEVFA